MIIFGMRVFVKFCFPCKEMLLSMYLKISSNLILLWKEGRSWEVKYGFVQLCWVPFIIDTVWVVINCFRETQTGEGVQMSDVGVLYVRW